LHDDEHRYRLARDTRERFAETTGDRHGGISQRCSFFGRQYRQTKIDTILKELMRILLTLIVSAFVSFALLTILWMLSKRTKRKSVYRSIKVLGFIVGGIFATLTLPVLVFELLLRHWAGRSLISLKIDVGGYSHHRSRGIGSWKLPANVMAFRDTHFSQVHWDEMTAGHRLKTEKWQPTESQPVLNRIVGELEGREFSYKNGMRTTTDSPDKPDNTIFCLGGSTTFCIEVANQHTWPSVLQRLINSSDSQKKYKVLNFGIPGTPGLERIQTFLNVTPVDCGDIAVFLFGANDSGWVQYGRRTGMVHKNLPGAIRFLLDLASYFELARWIYGEISPRYLRRLAIEMAETTIAAAEQSQSFASSRGAKVLFVLQPTIFTLSNPDEWDNGIKVDTARDLKVMLDAAYERYLSWIVGCDYAISAVSIFDQSTPSPYMGDWVHANTQGNWLIGDHIFREIKSRGWLD